MARVADSMVTFQDLDDMVSFEGFSYVANPITPPSNRNTCANKVKVLGYLDVRLSRSIANNQLVSYSIIVLPSVTDELTISPKNKEVSSIGQNYEIDVQSNTSWTVSESLNWVSLGFLNATGNRILTVIVAENSSTSDRSGDITFTTGDLTETHSITQAVAVDELTLSPSGATLIKDNPSQIQVSVESDASWSVGSTPDWFFVSVGNTNGNGNFIIEASNNDTNTIRSFDLTVSTQGTNPTSKIFRINQFGLYQYFTSVGNTKANACSNSPGTLKYSESPNFSNSTALWKDPEGTTPVSFSFHQFQGVVLEVNTNNNQVIGTQFC